MTDWSHVVLDVVLKVLQGVGLPRRKHLRRGPSLANIVVDWSLLLGLDDGPARGGWHGDLHDFLARSDLKFWHTFDLRVRVFPLGRVFPHHGGWREGKRRSGGDGGGGHWSVSMPLSEVLPLLLQLLLDESLLHDVLGQHSHLLGRRNPLLVGRRRDRQVGRGARGTCWAWGEHQGRQPGETIISISGTWEVQSSTVSGRGP